MTPAFAQLPVSHKDLDVRQARSHGDYATKGPSKVSSVTSFSIFVSECLSCSKARYLHKKNVCTFWDNGPCCIKLRSYERHFLWFKYMCLVVIVHTLMCICIKLYQCISCMSVYMYVYMSMKESLCENGCEIVLVNVYLWW